jgi:hypothetical protein
VNDFDRLVETSPHPLTRELLGVGLEDAPAASAAPRVAAALGLSLGVAATPAVAASAVATTTLAGGSASLGVAVVAKWLGMGLLAGTVVSGGAAIVRPRAPAPARPSVVLTAVPVPVGRAPADATEATGTPRAAEPETLTPDLSQPPTSATRRVPPAAATTAPPVATLPDQASALAHEVARIDEARLALRGGDAAGALSALARYDEERQTGVLDREAAVLRIEALQRAGKTNEAKGQARRYLERFPSDAHTASLRLLLGDTDGAQGIDR